MDKDKQPLCWKRKEGNEEAVHSGFGYSVLRSIKKQFAQKQMCWHAPRCEGGDKQVNDEPRIKEIAFALNRVLVKKLSQMQKGLSCEKISTLAKEELEFLTSVYQGFEKGKFVQDDFVATVFSPPFPGIESYRIDDPRNHAVILKAIDYECSEAAKRSVILYRGGEFENDKAYRIRSKQGELPKQVPYSICFGTGAFAGTASDPDASAAKNWFNEKNGQYRDSYLMLLPIGGDWKKWFYLPQANAVGQFYGGSDGFHARSKINQEDFAQKSYTGLCFQNKQVKDIAQKHFQTTLSKEDIDKAFQACKSTYGVLLRKADEIAS